MGGPAQQQLQQGQQQLQLMGGSAGGTSAAQQQQLQLHMSSSAPSSAAVAAAMSFAASNVITTSVSSLPPPINPFLVAAEQAANVAVMPGVGGVSTRDDADALYDATLLAGSGLDVPADAPGACAAVAPPFAGESGPWAALWTLGLDDAVAMPLADIWHAATSAAATSVISGGGRSGAAGGGLTGWRRRGCWSSTATSPRSARGSRRRSAMTRATAMRACLAG